MDKLKPNPYENLIKKEQDELVISYMPALRAMAFRLKERLPSSIEVGDLISVGAAQMVKLSRTYDQAQNDNFWGYAKKRVYGSMLDYLRELDFMSRANRKLVKDIDNAINEYFNKFEDEPDDEYLAEILQEDISKIREARSACGVNLVLSIDDNMDIYSQDNTEEIVEKEQLLDKIMSALSEFNQRDQLIIQLYYYEELSLKEISEILKITESRISQIHKRLVNKIRQKLGVENG